MRTGFSLLELTVALAIAGLGLSLLVPSARRQADRMAVLGAREATAAWVAKARREARLSGGAVLELRREGSRLWVESATGRAGRDTLKLESRFGVHMELPSASATLTFDALGLGRLASRTLVFTRNDARAVLVVSAYGRVRRP